MMGYTPFVTRANSGRHKEHRHVRPPVDAQTQTQASQAQPLVSADATQQRPVVQEDPGQDSLLRHLGGA
jgi:hypothetical protein